MNLLNNCDEVSSSSSKTTNNFNNLINSTTAEPPQPQPQPQGLSTSTTTTSASTRHHSPDIVYSSHTKSTLISKTPSDFIQTQPSSPEPASSIQTISNQITDDLPNQEVSVVTPFLVKHISDANMIPKDNFHKYCYRHNPDITCNKHTDEARMKLIQDQLDKLPNGDQQAITHVWSIFSAAPVQHRQLILQGLLSQCCFPQLSFISQEVSSLIKIDFISTLPQEISLKILCYLDCRSLCNAAQVSRKWKSLADDDRVWHYMCQQHIDRKCPNCGWGLPLMHMKRAREMTDDDNIKPIKRNDEQQQQQQQQQQGSSQAQSQVLDGEGQPDRKKVKLDTEDNHQKVVPTSVVVRKRPWKSVYSERFKLEKNWRKGTHTIKTFTGHSDGVTCLQFNRKYLMTGSYDTTIKIWKIDSGECVKTLTGHTKGVRALVFDNQKLISGGLDSTIKVWNYHTGQCIATYRGHEDAVVSVDFTNKSIVSGSADHTVRVWHVDSRTCYTLRGHTDWVNHVKIHLASNTIFSASDDTTIRMWDMNSNECIKVFGGMENNGHIGQVQCIIPFTYKEELIEDESESDSENNQNSTTTTTTTTSAAATATATAMGATLGTNNISLPNDTATINRSTFTPSNNNTATTATTPNSYPTHFLTSALDNTIKLWDVATGKCIRTQFGHIEGVWSIAADTFRIISGAHDRLIKVWDLQNGKCLHTFSNNLSVSCVGLSDSRFVAGLENGEVKMYCFD